MEETTDVVAAPSEEIVPDEGDEDCEEDEEATPDPYLCTPFTSAPRSEMLCQPG